MSRTREVWSATVNGWSSFKAHALLRHSTSYGPYQQPYRIHATITRPASVGQRKITVAVDSNSAARAIAANLMLWVAKREGFATTEYLKKLMEVIDYEESTHQEEEANKEVSL